MTTMAIEISLRDVCESDLPILFEQQRDVDAVRMACFPSRDRDAFMAHWAKCMADETAVLKAILFHGEVAGSIVCWQHAGACLVGYWLGKKYWGQGIATAALTRLRDSLKTRPLYAHVARTNLASIRVLQKYGFIHVGESTIPGPDGAETEFIMCLQQ